jgi:starch synthase
MVKPISSPVIKVLFLTAEACPYVKIGGLGDVSGTLPEVIMRHYASQIDLRLLMPFHLNMQIDPSNIVTIGSFTMSFPDFSETITILQDKMAAFPIFFLQSPILSATKPYSSDSMLDLSKYSLFSQAVKQFCSEIHWEPDILHANDWHTALSVYQAGTPAFRQSMELPLKTLLSIHNLPYMGASNRDILRKFSIFPANTQALPDWARTIPLSMGISRADRVLTVSNGYAQEIKTPEFGCGLDTYFREHEEKVGGILNGIDQYLWNPEIDPLIHQPFSVDQLALRSENKKYLFAQHFPKSTLNTPLLIWVGRLQGQKGADILLESLQALSKEDWRCIILGTGDPDLEETALSLSAKLPEKLLVLNKFDDALSHQLYASGDMIIIPSRYEPCGLSQMFAMHYGCLAVATATGGLKDTIDDIEISQQPTGFLFSEANPNACTIKIHTAIEFYNQKADLWKLMQQRAMKKDFSWYRSAEQYKNEYLNLMENPS